MAAKSNLFSFSGDGVLIVVRPEVDCLVFSVLADGTERLRSFSAKAGRLPSRPFWSEDGRSSSCSVVVVEVLCFVRNLCSFLLASSLFCRRFCSGNVVLV